MELNISQVTENNQFYVKIQRSKNNQTNQEKTNDQKQNQKTNWKH